MARNLVRFDPFAELTALKEQLFSEGLFSPSRKMMPITDVYTEDDSQLTVEANLPGFHESDISVDVDQGVLVIQAEKHEKEEDKGKRYVVRESSASYYRRIALPEQADEDQVSATFTSGVLKVTVPFKALPAARKITISPAKDTKEDSK
ncbi:Hsp20/alpha crystallin family protein [Agromyces sp. NPDC055520]